MTPPPPPPPFAVTVDLVDLYSVPPPLPQPAAAVSVVAHGADPSGVRDSKAAFAEAITDALKPGGSKLVFVPAGNYQHAGHCLLRSGVVVRGAGPWHTVIRGGSGEHPSTAVGIQRWIYLLCISQLEVHPGCSDPVQASMRRLPARAAASESGYMTWLSWATCGNEMTARTSTA